MHSETPTIESIKASQSCKLLADGDRVEVLS